MDLGLVFRALIRHKALLALSLLLGLGMALTSVYQIEIAPEGGLMSQQRAPTVYRATKTIIVDQSGFGLGRGGQKINPYQYDRIIRLTNAYSEMITSSKVMALIDRKMGRFPENQIRARPVRDSSIIKIHATSTAPGRASRLAEVTVEAFETYLRQMQQLNHIPEKERMVIISLGPAKPAQPIQPRRFQIALLYFMVPVAGLSLASLLLENVKRGGGADDGLA